MCARSRGISSPEIGDRITIRSLISGSAIKSYPEAIWLTVWRSRGWVATLLIRSPLTYTSGDNAFKLLTWISDKYGFGTYIQYIQGYYSSSAHDKAKEALELLIERTESRDSNVYVDTIVSPSYTSAIAQIKCPICFQSENPCDFSSTECSHEFCSKCIVNYINTSGKDECPLCRQKMTVLFNAYSDESQFTITTKQHKS